MFHIHISNASHRPDGSWKQLLGDNFLIAKSDDVSKVIVEAIRNNYSGEVAAHAESEADSEMAEDSKKDKFY